jgi:chromate transporter
MPPPPITWHEAFLFWFKLGWISFGGPAGQIALMHKELVEERRWISERRFLHALNYCMLLPGPEAQQLATYIGWLMHKTWGGIMAGVLFLLPSLLILIGLSWLYIAYGNLPWVAGLFYGVKPAVTAIVLQAAHRMGSKALKNSAMWAIAGGSFVAIFALQVPFPLIVLAAATIGYLGGRLYPASFQSGGHSAAINKTQDQLEPAVIDDDTPTPAHAQFKKSRLLMVLSLGLMLWILPIWALVASVGWDHIYTQMSWFFTKAALLTFGGAYAVLPYVYQGAVDSFGWLSPTQMVDGLALGESTPGPLIMVVAFVAFVGAYLSAAVASITSPLVLFASGAMAAALVTWFTFLPSFIFIFAGGPLIESTHNNLKFTAPLTAITAAVVGVIVNLALFFGYHVLWPTGFGNNVWANFDGAAAFIALAAAIALFQFKLSVIRVIALSALTGLLITTLHP